MKKYLSIAILIATVAIASAQTNTNNVATAGAATLEAVLPPPNAIAAPRNPPAPSQAAPQPQVVISPEQIRRLVALMKLMLVGQLDEHGDYNTQAVARSRTTQLADALRFEIKAQENLKELTELVDLLDKATRGAK